jgi:hypothetical protein
MLIRKSANTRPAAKLITSLYRKTLERDERERERERERDR